MHGQNHIKLLSSFWYWSKVSHPEDRGNYLLRNVCNRLPLASQTPIVLTKLFPTYVSTTSCDVSDERRPYRASYPRRRTDGGSRVQKNGNNPHICALQC